MNLRNALTALAVALTACVLNSAAQNRTARADFYDSFGGVYHPYTHGPGSVTPAPNGYKAFYISHVGRHGSRFPVDEKYIANGLLPLRQCAEEGLMTEAGEKLLRGFEKLDSVSRGMYGHLCELGGVEHKGIAERMYRNFPEVFAQRGRDSIYVQCTHRQRCLESALNFCSVLKGSTPRTRMGFVSGEKYYDILSNAEIKPIRTRNVQFSKVSDEVAAREMDFDALYSRLFTDPARARQIIASDRLMAETMYANGTVALYLGIDEIYDSCLPDEYETAARNYAGKMYCQHCNSRENGEYRVAFAHPLLGDIISRTDAAVGSGAGNGLSADLRFTHDTGMMPFFGLIGLEGFDKAYTFMEAYHNWDPTKVMCMGTNLQMVFYRNRKGDVLVKLLLNETETSIPALGPGPFYPWPALRQYLAGR